MKFWDWYVFFRAWKFGPISSAVKAAWRRYGPITQRPPRLLVRTWQKTWFELLVLTYPTAALIGWLLS